jgi:hypothetical protein
MTLLNIEGKKAAVTEAAEEYARLYKGHPSVESILRSAKRMKGTTIRDANSK